MATKTSRVTLKIEPELHDWFRYYAERNKSGMSEIVRDFILILKKIDDKGRVDNESGRLHSS